MDELAFVSLWGIHLLILMRRDKTRFVTNIRTDTVACGVANLLGNKGAVGCCFVTMAPLKWLSLVPI